jgi:hypothetical protein
MTKSQSLYGKGRYDGRMQGILGTIFFVGLAIAILLFISKKKQQEVLA